MWSFLKRTPKAPSAATVVRATTEGHTFHLDLPARWQIRATLDDADNVKVRISASVPYSDEGRASGVLKDDDLDGAEIEAIREVLTRVRDAHREHMMHRALDAMSLSRNVGRTLGEVK